MGEEKAKYGLFTSSVNPEKLSLTVRGILTGLIPVVLLISGVAGADVSAGEIEGIIEVVGKLIVQIGGVVSLGMILWGGVRKILVRFQK